MLPVLSRRARGGAGGRARRGDPGQAVPALGRLGLLPLGNELAAGADGGAGFAGDGHAGTFDRPHVPSGRRARRRVGTCHHPRDRASLPPRPPHQGGQRAREYEAALTERAATPVHVIPAALAALGLTLKLQRPRRRMPLAGAVALGMGLSMVLWAASVIAHAIAVSGALEPWIAAAIPGLLSALIAALTLLRA
ncbi:MAG: LptF/LptG family permease [Deltaproteobacteria bacterium]|nr:MAG: LptF/LptG family permease [Deltaproteobacteria bacterium]